MFHVSRSGWKEMVELGRSARVGCKLFELKVGGRMRSVNVGRVIGRDYGVEQEDERERETETTDFF